MPLMYQKGTLLMTWCLNCHREPEKFVRPQDKVYDVDWTPPMDQLDQGRKLVHDNNINTKINCSTCHR